LSLSFPLQNHRKKQLAAGEKIEKRQGFAIALSWRMPLCRHHIRSAHALTDPELYRAADSNDSEALLEAVAMAGLVGFLRQLGDLAQSVHILSLTSLSVTASSILWLLSSCSCAQGFLYRAGFKGVLLSLKKEIFPLMKHFKFNCCSVVDDGVC